MAPLEWPDHGKAFSVALEAVEAVLNGEAQPDAVELLVQVLDVAEAALRAVLLDRAERADVMVVGNTAHRPGGCGYARRADPAVVGSYQRNRLPLFLSAAQGDRWLSAGPKGKRRRCRWCWPGQ